MRMALLLTGAHVGVATLQAWCPTASRRAITRWRRRERRRDRDQLHVVRWTQPGRVWAMDFSQPPHPIDGRYRYVLHVRDLASGYQLAALPVRRATTPAVCDLLRALAAAHDAPLVLKVDNGSAFGSGDLRAWAQAAGTRVLYSPPRYPRYNGSIEASIGALTTRAHHAAAAAGHPEYWTTDDVEGARADANLTRQSGGHSRSAAHRWRASRCITVAERRRFATHYADAMTRQHGGTVRVQQRIAIVHTLRVLGYVSMKRRMDLVRHFTNEKRQTLRA